MPLPIWTICTAQIKRRQVTYWGVLDETNGQLFQVCFKCVYTLCLHSVFSNTLENAKISLESLGCFGRPQNPIIIILAFTQMDFVNLNGQMPSVFDLLVKSTT